MRTIQAQVGQPAAIQHCGSWTSTFQTGYTVTKVTPSGQVVVTRDSDGYQRRFSADGREMGKSYSKDWLRLDVAAVERELAGRAAARDASDAINALTSEDNRCKPTYSARYMQERIAIMEAQLAAAKAAVARLAAL